MAKTGIVPLGDHVVVEAVEQETTTKGGFILPETSKEKPMQGKVIAVGPGKMMDDGKRQAMDLKVGDTVIFTKYGPTEFKLDGKEYLILSQSDIYAKIQG